MKLRNLAGLLLLSTAHTAIAGLANTDDPFVGQTWAVACREIPLHKTATGHSTSSSILKYRDEVKIVELIDKYELPESQQNGDDLDPITGLSNRATKYSWAKVELGGRSGFVPISCLVNGSVINGPYEDPEKFSEMHSKAGNTKVSSRGFSRKERGDRVAMRGMSSGGEVKECTESDDSNTVSSRGFSRKERGDRVAMRGMSTKGNSICIKEDFDGLSESIKKTVFVSNPYKEDLEFRKAGKLGEFK